MILTAWNIRGLGKRATYRSLKKLIQDHNPDVVFLMETRIKRCKLERHRHSLGFKEGYYFTNESTAGGLALWRKVDIKLEVLALEKNFIDVVFDDGKKGNWFATFCYGSPYLDEKEAVFQSIQALRSNLEQPWCLLGDFNEVRFQSEKMGGNPIDRGRATRFNDFIFECELLDLPIPGGEFTWSNNRQGEGSICEKLDRILLNTNWNFLFPNSSGFVDAAVESDHKPLILFTDKKVRRGKRLFRFEAKWLTEEICPKIVSDVWEDLQDGNISEKLSETSKRLSKWSKEHWGKLKEKEKDIKSRLSWLQNQARTEEFQNEIDVLYQELDQIWKNEELHWFQRSGQDWMKWGDQNSSFYHASTIFNRKRNRITRIKDGSNNWIEDKAQILSHIESYFQELFKKDEIGSFQEALDAINPVISEEENRRLNLPVNKEEVKKATFGMGPFKSPGPDGFPGVFYQKFWQKVETDLMRLVSNFFDLGILPEDVNHTHLVLIPKQDDPENLGQYRPISLCNYAYKIISKILTSRMKPLLSGFIDQAQSAFVAGRQIQDNIIVSHECFNALKKRKKKGEGAFAVKLDLAKAYDKVSWEFLESAMIKLGFSVAWVDKIMKCVTSTTFSVLVNGKPSLSFKPEKGLRQGDPMSPYLFLIVANVFSLLIQKATRDGSLKGFEIKKRCPIVTHLIAL